MAQTSRREWLYLSAAALTTIGAATMALEPRKADDLANDSNKKLTERLAVLEEIVRLEQQSFRGGSVARGSVIASHRELLQAKLELTKDPAKRIEFLAEQVQAVKELEEEVRRMVEGSQATRVELLKATAARLKAEADLAQAKEISSAPKS